MTGNTRGTLVFGGILERVCGEAEEVVVAAVDSDRLERCWCRVVFFPTCVLGRD